MTKTRAHEPIIGGEFMVDWVLCSCGWRSHDYFDGVAYAWEEWSKHAENARRQERQANPPAEGQKPWPSDAPIG